MENELIMADCIESTEFPELAGKYSVYAVPKTVINGEGYVEGSLAEQPFLEFVLSQLGTGTEAASP